MKELKTPSCTVGLVQSLSELKDYLYSCEDNSILTKDWETTGLDFDAVPLGLSLHQRGRNPIFVPIDFHFSKGFPMKEVAEICNEQFPRFRLIAHNAKYDSMISVMNGIKDECFSFYVDTLQMIHLYNPNLAMKLEDRVLADFGYAKKDFKEISGKPWNRINWSLDGDELLELLAGYAGEDTYWETKLYYKYMPLLDEHAKRLLFEVEMPMINILRDAKIRGVLINKDLLLDFDKHVDRALSECLDSIYEECGCVFNLNSAPQKQKVFFDQMKLPVIKTTKKGGRSTDAGTYEEWANMGYSVGEALLDYSELQKLITGYIRAIPPQLDSHNVLRGDLNSAGTKTGRMSSSGPNLQNMPNNHNFPVRAAFIPRPGYVFVNYDYSQLELRVMAHVSHDKHFMDIFLHGGDPHGDVAKRCGITRKQAKCVNENTLIFTDKGVLRIGEVSMCRLKDTFDSPMISSVFNGSEMIGVNSFYSNGCDNTLGVITKRGIVRSSVNHQYVMADGTLKCAKDLEIGDEISENTQLTYEGSETTIDYNPFFDSGDAFSIKMDSQWAYIAGVLTGDGCFSAKHIGVSVGKGRFFKSWRKILKDEFAKKGLPLTERSNINYMYLGSSRFVKFMVPFGLSDERGKKNFKIPLWVLNGTVEMRKNFLGGLIDTDGTISEKGTTSICTKSIQLAEDLCFLLNSIGYNFGVESSWNSTYEKWYFRIHIYSDSLSDLLGSNVIKCPHKVVSLTERVSKVGRGAKNSPNKVLQVLSLGTDYLCDLNVDSEKHLYMTGTLVTHNTMNFGVLYGMGVGKYVNTFKVSKERARQMIDDYHKVYSGFAKWKESTETFAKRNGYVRTIFGRIRQLPEASKDPFHRDDAAYFGALRQAVNTVIQGSGADIVKKATIAMCRKFKERNLDAHFLLQVHDEVLIEARIDQMFEVERIVIDCMENTVKLDVPLLADGKILANWGEMKDDDVVSLPYRFDYSIYSSLFNIA